MLRFLTAGESHGPQLTVIVEGLPAGIPLQSEAIDTQLARRQAGYGRGGRMQIERDRAVITAGVRGGLTLGSPVCLVISNRDWPNWRDVMAVGPEASLDQRVVTRPRPGHADLAGGMKYGHRDLRNILERSSARETAARVAAGAVARALLTAVGITIAGHVTRIGAAAVQRELTLQTIQTSAPVSPLFCADQQAEQAMMAAIDAAREAGDTLGGVFEVLAWGLPPGLGSHVHWDRRLDGQLAQAVMSIQAIKGVEIGDGFSLAARPGSQAHDEISYSPERGYSRNSNHAGGLEGGISNGEMVVVRAAMKPIPTLSQPLASVDIATRKQVVAAVERSDTCAVPAACVVGEAAVAWVLADNLLQKTGGDSRSELNANLEQYREAVRQY